MLKRQTGLICLFLVVVMGALGVSYSIWQQNLNASVTSITIAAPPAVTTDSPTNINADTATLNGYLSRVAPGNSNVTVSFEYGATTGYGLTVAASPSSVSALYSPFSVVLTGLTSGQTYHYRARGLGFFTIYGWDRSFVAGPPVYFSQASYSSDHTGPGSGVYPSGSTIQAQSLAINLIIADNGYQDRASVPCTLENNNSFPIRARGIVVSDDSHGNISVDFDGRAFNGEHIAANGGTAQGTVTLEWSHQNNKTYHITVTYLIEN